jgi:hypothetical protein
VLIGDDRLFFLFCTNAAGYGWYGRNSYCFGDHQLQAGRQLRHGAGCRRQLLGMSNYWSYPGQFSGYGLVRPWTSPARCCCATTPNSATRCGSG